MPDDRRQVLADPDRHPQHRAHLGDRERRTDAVAAGVGQEQDRALGVGGHDARTALAGHAAAADHVVGVAAGLLGWLVPGVDVEAGHGRDPLG